ncbi:hypothetical protein ACROYT_G044397 [Oculina patagonica]
MVTTIASYHLQVEFPDNIQLLSEIREPVWLYLRQRCSSFEARDCNAAFSQIFEEKIFGTLNTEEVNLFATQRMFESYCERCEKKVTLDSRIFLTFVSQSELSKHKYDNISWPLYVSDVHTQPGRLNCKDCGCLANEPLVTSVVNSKFLFIEFAPEIRESVFIYDKIQVGNSFYALKAFVRCSQAHFTCAVHSFGKWLYFDDLRKSVREYGSFDLLQTQIPGGWFFAVFELIIESDCIDQIVKTVDESINITEKSNIEENYAGKEQKVSDTFSETVKESQTRPSNLTNTCDKSQTVTSAHASTKTNSIPRESHCINKDEISNHFQTTTNKLVGKRTSPVVQEQNSVQSKKIKFETKCSSPEEVFNQDQNHNTNKCFAPDLNSDHVKSTNAYSQGISSSPNVCVNDEGDKANSEESLIHNVD